MPKGIILTADDFGPSRSINEGIYQGIEAGIVSAVSAFVTFGEENHHNIIQLKEYIDTIDTHPVGIGLHFTITAGSPVNGNRYRTLTIANGNFSLFDFFRWNVSLEEFEQELDAQLSKLAELLGGIEYIDHINCHQGICFLKKEFWEILLSKGLPVRSPIKFSYQHTWYDDKWPLTPINRIAIARALRRPATLKNFRQKKRYLIKNSKNYMRKKRFNYAKDLGIQIPDSCLFSYYKQANTRTLINVVEQLEKGDEPNETVEIMLHLCSDNFPSDINDFWGVDPKSILGRKKELDCLIESKIIQAMQAANIQQICYRNLPITS